MNIEDLQRRIGAAADGVFGPKSRTALLAHFTNTQANAITDRDIADAAARLGASAAQVPGGQDRRGCGHRLRSRWNAEDPLRAAQVHRQTGGRFSPAPFSQCGGGGYTDDVDKDGIKDSWDRLSEAIATGQVDAAFQSCSWGLFQVMGEWWDELGYPSPYAMAWTTVQSEGDQLELFIRYIEHFRLQDELRAISVDPVTCRPFAAAYNGPGYRAAGYDVKIARAMR